LIQRDASFLAMTEFRSKEKQTVILALIAAAYFFVIAIEKKVNKLLNIVRNHKKDIAESR